LKRTLQVKIIARFGILLFVIALCALADVPGFKVTKRYSVPGNGDFDYIVFDSSSNRLYISHGTEVNVLDASSGNQLGKIEGTPGVHGIAIVPTLHRGFTTNGANSTVSVFDTNTLKTIKTFSVPKGPDFILYDPLMKRVLICHEDAAAITVIDPEKSAVVGTINLGGGPEAAVLNGKGIGFVNLEAQAMVARFDPQALVVREKWPIPGCKGPVPIAMDTSTARLFIGCRSRVLAVMNADNGKVITTLPIGDKVDAVVFDPDTKTIFASNGEGTVSVIRQKGPNEYELVGSIQTQKSAKTMAFDPRTKRLFLSAVEMESGGRINTSQGKAKPGTFGVLVIERQ
jgi:DNA-binding beta-propeller fold protein YncE